MLRVAGAAKTKMAVAVGHVRRRHAIGKETVQHPQSAPREVRVSSRRGGVLTAVVFARKHEVKTARA